MNWDYVRGKKKPKRKIKINKQKRKQKNLKKNYTTVWFCI